jgi:hypothetical protein
MTDEIVVETQPVEPAQEVPSEPVAVESTPTAPTGKKRGRKPKSALPPPIEAPKPVKKRRNAPRISKGDRAFQSAIASTDKERAKCIEELSKIMEQWDVKQARLKSLDWKISTLKGTTQTSSIAGMQLSPYGQQPSFVQNSPYGMPPAYPPQATNFMPPSMRTPTLPVVPQANGGAIAGIVETPVEEGEDQFLSGAGVMGGKGWV